MGALTHAGFLVIRKMKLLHLFEDFLIDLGGVLLHKFLFPALFKHVLIITCYSATHVGHILGLVNHATLKYHHDGICLALGLLTNVECEVIGILVLALLHYHALHADVGSVFVVKSVGQSVGTKLGDIGLNQVQDAVALGAEDDALEVGLVPVVAGAILGIEFLLRTTAYRHGTR